MFLFRFKMHYLCPTKSEEPSYFRGRSAGSEASVLPLRSGINSATFIKMKTENNNENLNSPPESIIVTSVGVLKSAFLQWNREQIQAREAMKEEVMLDEIEVLERLGKSHATLWRWNNSGYLPRYKLGGKNRYKESDVLRIMKAQKIHIGSTKTGSDGSSSPLDD